MKECRKTMPLDLECGFGVYLTPEGKYHYTQVQSKDAAGIDKMSIRYPNTAKMVAVAHTHPKDKPDVLVDSSSFLSPEDLAYAKKSGYTMFMGSEQTGNVVRYDHGKSKTTKHARLGRISYGDLVGPYVEEEPPPTRREQIEAAYDLHTPPPAKP